MKKEKSYNSKILVGIILGIFLSLVGVKAASNTEKGTNLLYNNSKSGLSSTNVQGAIDEVSSNISGVSTNVTNLQETSNDLRNNNSITFNAVDKIVELPTSYGVLKGKYLHSPSSTNAINNDARLYCVYIDEACKISASNFCIDSGIA